jgi:SAM-dependent methyltransferase
MGRSRTDGTLFRVRADDPQYTRQLREEAEFWNRPEGVGLDDWEPKQCAPVDAYINGRLTGDGALRWFEKIPRYGRFRRGVFVGVSGMRQEARILETNPELQAEFLDISEDSLRRRQTELGARFPGRISTRQVDLNFVELPDNAYDVVISSATMHHLINLEHVACAINDSLADDGLFFLEDYVAEARFQFVPEKRCLFEAFIARAKRCGQFPRQREVSWPPLTPWNFSPFEAIRSDDTLHVLGQCLECIELHSTSAIAGLMLFTCATKEPNALHSLMQKIGLLTHDGISRTFFHDLILLDEVVSESGILRPLNAFAVYRKRLRTA